MNKGIKERPFLVGLRRSPLEWKRRPTQIKSSEKEKVPGVRDWSPSNGKINQVCLKAIELWELSFLVCVCVPDLCKIWAFIGFQTTAPLSIASLLCPLKRDSIPGWDTKVSIRPCLRELPWCIYDFVCLSPRGILKAGHFAVSHLMPATTHLMCIKCGDSLYLLTRAAHLDAVCPPRMNWIRAALIWRMTY